MYGTIFCPFSNSSLNHLPVCLSLLLEFDAKKQQKTLKPPPIFPGLLSSLPFPGPANIYLPFCLTSYLDSRSAASSPLRTYTQCNQTHGDGEDTKNLFVLLPFYHFLPPPKTPLSPQPALTDHHHHYPISLSLSPSQPPYTPFLVLTLPCIRSDFIYASLPLLPHYITNN